MGALVGLSASAAGPGASRPGSDGRRPAAADQVDDGPGDVRRPLSIQDASSDARGAPAKDVSTEPGAIVVTLTPCGRTSSIRQAAKWSSAALLAQ